MHAVRPDSLVSNIGDNVEFWFGGVDAFVSRLFESLSLFGVKFFKIVAWPKFSSFN